MKTTDPVKTLGLYLHIPFCARKCAYCDFYSICDLTQVDAYIQALAAQIKSFRVYRKTYIVDTVYFGGGTPSILTGEQIGYLLDAIRKTFRLTDDAEITIEANPGMLDTEKLAGYRQAGINRLSIGLQSADDEELKLLSRIHTRDEFEENFYLARLEGFDNISVDLMYGLPYQTEETLMSTLDYLIAMDPEHISLYGLRMEPGTAFGDDEELQRCVPDDETWSHLYLKSSEKLARSGFLHYEISNFAKLGFECRHNIRYWKCEEYLGFGPAAHSFIEGKRFSYTKEFKNYILDPTDFTARLEEMQEISAEEQAKEFVMLGFRMVKGVNVEEYNQRFQDDFDARYKEDLQKYIDLGFVIPTSEGYRLSENGFMVSNYILREILQFEPTTDEDSES